MAEVRWTDDRYGTRPHESDGELVMPWLDPAVTDHQRLALGLPAVQDVRAYISEVNRRRAEAQALIEGLPPGAEARRVWRPWSRSALLERWEREGAACWREGDELVFVHRADADRVRLTMALQCDMWRVDGDLWAVGYRLRRIEEAFVSYMFVAGEDIVAAYRNARVAVWRGPAAPVLPARAPALRGELRVCAVPSRHLAAPRTVHVYLSPGWRESSRTLVVQAADSAHRAHVIEPLVLEGTLPPVVCLGVEHLDGNDGRVAEYLPGHDPARFAAHLAFQADELPVWTADELGLEVTRQRRIVTGQSNGGAFAVAAGIERPDVFGHVLAFSVAGGRPEADLRLQDAPAAGYDLVAGTLEPFRRTTRAWLEALTGGGVPVTHREYVAGHDPALWDLAFVRGLEQLAAAV